MIDTKEKVIKLFNTYFDNIENEYNISNEDIQHLKNKVKQDIDNVDKIYYVPKKIESTHNSD